MNQELDLKELRDQQGISGALLADKIGVTQSYVSQLETGVRKNPSLDTINRFASALGVDAGTVLNAIQLSQRRRRKGA